MKSPLSGSVFSLVCAAALLAGCGGESADGMLASAKDYLANKDRTAAVIQLKNVLQKNPDSAEARFLLGQTLLQNGDAGSALIELRKAQALKYPASKVVPLIARALNTGRDHRTVTGEFGSLLLPDREPAADLKTSVAVAYSAQQNPLKARAAMQAALDLAPGYTPALLLEARLEAGDQHFDKAFSSIDKVLSLKPDDAEALVFRGLLLLHAKSDPKAAVEEYQKALAVDPKYLPAHISLIDAFLGQRDIPAAAAQLEALRKVHPNHLQTNYFDAQLAYIGNDNKKATELIQKVLKWAPGNPQVLQLAGAIELKNQALLRAENHLGKALQIAPSLVGARHLLAQTYIVSGQPEKALATLGPLLAAGDNDAEALSLAAQARVQTGDLKQAESDLLKAAKADPTKARSRVALALARFKGGDLNDALGQIAVIAGDSADTYADMVLVNVYIRKGALDKAFAAVQAMEKKQPDKPYAANLRGRLQLLRRDKADAQRSFERALAIDPAFVPAAVSLAALDIGDNKPDQAQKRFDVVLAADPKNMHALLAVAGLRSRAGAPARDVAALLGDVVRLHPAEVSPRLVLVEHHLAHNEPKLALTVAQDAAAVLPRDADLLDALGRTQAAVGERNQAINSFNKLASLQPRSPQASMRLADLYRDGGNADQARHYFKRALDVKPDLLEAQRALADLELKSGHPNEALAIARTVRRQRPSDPVGFSLEGSVEFQKKNFQAAIDLFRAGLKQSRSVELACKLHAALAASGKQADADKLAASWLAEHPGDTVFLSYLADNLLAERKYQAAEDLLRRVDRLMPGNAVVMNNIAWSMVQQDKPEAVEYAQKANDLFPNVPALMDTLAAALLLRNQVAEAIDIQKKALAIAPDAHGLRLSLARMYIQAGDKPAARAELDRLAKLQGPNSQQPEAARLLKML